MKSLKRDVSIAMNDIQSFCDYQTVDDLKYMVGEYNCRLGEVLNKHAPLIKKEIPLRKPTPWSSDEIRGEKQKRRQLERKMNKTKLDVDKQAFKKQKNKVNILLNARKADHFSRLINDNKDDPKGLFKTINKALNRRGETSYPPHTSEKELADNFSRFFNNKISNIRENLDSQKNTVNDQYKTENAKFTVPFNEFKALNEDEVRELVKKSPNKYCELDPLPTWILRDCLEEILPILTKIINLSLQLGDMPTSLKHAIIKPLLKKLGLQLIEKNYRPVSNLPYLSKLIERAVAVQLMNHLKLNNLMDLYQSAYRMFHSTETALLKVRNDILMEMDKRNTVMLVLLDLSAAFDTIDHGILIERLSKRCGLGGTVLSWFKSYISDRTQSVAINDCYSNKQSLKYGVPQGSVLGPILFTIYMSPLSEIMRDHELNYHSFADDTQVYLGFSPKDGSSQLAAKSKVENCIHDIRKFMTVNKLKLNDDKTEFMIIGSAYWLSKVNFDHIMIGNTKIVAVDKARNLGIIFDKAMGLECHINYACKTSFFNLKNLASIRNILDAESAKVAAHAFVTSHLDYGNSLLSGLPDKYIRKLQLVQNAAARVVVKKKKFDHISLDMKNMHWLPINARIKFKIILLTWKALNDMAPRYLANLLTVQEDHYERRYKNLLHIPKTNLVTCGDRAFQKVAPELWNALPCALREINKLNTFKSKLKTYLFQQYYP